MLHKFNYLIVLLIAVGCTLNEPKLPTWDTEWTLYLPTDSFIMGEEVINDSTLISGVDGQGRPIINLSLADSTDWERVTQSDLAIDPDDSHYEAEIGTIALDTPEGVKSEEIGLTDILPASLLAMGDTLPPYDPLIVTPSIKTVEYDHYKRALIDSGYICLVFYNNLYLTIREGMEIKIYNNGDNKSLIDILRFDRPISYKDTVQSNIIDLAGKELSNRFLLEYTIPIAGSDTFQVLTEERKAGSCYSVLNMDGLKVSEATAKIPEQTFEQSDIIELTDQEHRLKRAVVESGSLLLRIKNNIPARADIDMELPDFSKDGQIKKINKTLPVGATFTEIIDLRGWEITNHKNPSAFLDDITYSVNALIHETQEYVDISARDSVSIDVEIDSLFLSYIEGELSPVYVDLEEQELSEFDFFEDITGNARFEDLVMTMKFETEVDLPIFVDLQITGYHYDQLSGMITDSVKIMVDEKIERSGISPITTITLDKNYSNPKSIVDLIEIFPTLIRVSGEAYIEGEGSVSVGDGLRAVYNIESPLAVQITNPVFYEMEIDSIKEDDIDDDARESITRDVEEAYIKITLSNGLPLSTNVKYILAADSMALLDDQIADSSKKIIINATVDAGNTGNSGYVDQPENGTVEIRLSQNQLGLFNSKPIYTRQIVTLNPTNGLVRIRQTDEIGMTGVLSVKYLMNNEE